eukprot:TRINITY_DN3691_c1_g1_i1.p4 TRINITY_DN3691_c1_g1~~TRINITY_DN3691_c1_g1_i1.p4  ORF type:complete len:207 (-),score=7.92 TRINITY_DN3691_c1_g1_i1:670-1242(-)
MGGLGVGGRMRVVVPAALASWVDALRAGAGYSPALRDLGVWLRARGAVGGGGERVALPPVVRGGPAPPLPSVAGAAAAPPSGCGLSPSALPRSPRPQRAGLRAGRGTRTSRELISLGVAPTSRRRRTPAAASPGAGTGCAGQAAAGFASSSGVRVLAPAPTAGLGRWRAPPRRRRWLPPPLARLSRSPLA